MNTSATGLLAAISPLAAHFRKRTWTKARVLIRAAILCPGSRTVANCLRTIGLDRATDFAKFHRVLSRAPWSGLACAQTLLKLLVAAFAPGGQRAEHEPLVFAVDETIERRWGPKIAKRSTYRDPVRSMHNRLVTTCGLRWMSLTLVTALPWSGGVAWALPVLTALCPSARYYEQRVPVRTRKRLSDFARQVLRWIGRNVASVRTGLGRRCILCGDGEYCTYALMHAAREADVALVTRMRLDARLFHDPPPRRPGTSGRPPVVGKRLVTMERRLTDGRCRWDGATVTEWYGGREVALEWHTGRALWYKGGKVPAAIRYVLLRDPSGVHKPVLLASSDPELSAEWIVKAYVRRWRAEVTFAEVRRHLGVGSQRHWSDRAVDRATPALFAMKSVVCMAALPLWAAGDLQPVGAAWYAKRVVTFSDVLTAVRERIWDEQDARWIGLRTSPPKAEVAEPIDLREAIRRRSRAVRSALIRAAA